MKKYCYIKIGGKYYCQQQSILRLAGLLLISRKICPDFVNWTLLLQLFLNRINIKQYPSELELPVFGAWCLRGRRGYKVIDPYVVTATKLFDDDVEDELIRKEIEHSLYVGGFAFAPSMRSWSVEERWYQEEALFGKGGYYFSPNSPEEFMRIYYKYVAPCLVHLTGFGEHKRITINQCLETMEPIIREQLGVLDKKAPEVSEPAREFMDYVSRELSAHRDEEIFTVFGHGDFHLFNMFVTASGLKLIDWEDIGEHSLMYDFYTYFFSHLWTGRGGSVKGNEIANAVRDMAERYEGTDVELALSLSERPDLYRQLYYVERIFAMLSRFELQPQFLLPWVNIYREFEADRA